MGTQVAVVAIVAMFLAFLSLPPRSPVIDYSVTIRIDGPPPAIPDRNPHR